MNKYLTLLLLTFTSISAQEVQEKTPHNLHLKHEKASPFYVTAKPMLTSGGDLKEDDKKLSGGMAYGLGFDLGYYVHPRIAMEFSGTYSTNEVTETNVLEESEKANGYYTSAALNIVYKQPIFDDFVLFGKLGYEWEHEKVKDFGIKGNDYGVDFALGATYELDHHLAVLLEYEYSTIASLRGDAYFIGVEYRF